MNGAAALCFPWVNTLCWLRVWRLGGCRQCWNEVLPATVAVIVNSIFLSVCPCRGPESTEQTCARGQEEQEEGEEGQTPAGIYSGGHGAEQGGQTSDEGVGCVQTDNSPHLLPLPLPPDIEGDEDPH